MRSIGGRFRLRENPQLLHIPDFDGLVRIGQEITIEVNNKLITVGSFPRLETIGGDFNFTNNRQLTMRGTYPVLRSIGNNFKVDNCDKLQKINNFPSLTTIKGNLEIKNNAVLKSIGNFPVLGSIEGKLQIEDNDLLGDCCGLSGLLSGSIITGSIIIEDNAVGCDSESQINTPLTLISSNATTIVYGNTDPITIDFILGCGVTGWTSAITYTPENANFITLSSTGSTTQTGAITVMATPTENTGVERTATITLTTTGSTGTAMVTITQSAAPHTITLTSPTGDTTIDHDVVVAQTIRFNVGGGATGWTSEITGANFITLNTAMNDAQRGGVTVMATPTANTGKDDRSATIMFTTTGGTATAATFAITITQLAPVVAAPPTLVLTSPPTVMLDHDVVVEQTIRFTVGGSASGWTSSMSGDDFIMLSGDDGTVTGDVVVTATPSANTGVERSVMITFTTEGGTGDAATATVTITQSAAPPSLVLTSSSTVTLPHDVVAEQTITFTVGGSASGWTSAITGDDFITLTDDGATTGDVVVTATPSGANTGAARSAVITFTTAGGTGTAATAMVTITQSVAGAPTLLLTSPFMVTLAHDVVTAQMITFTVGDATGWTSEITGDNFITLTDDGAMMGDVVVTATPSGANTGVERSAMITFTTEGGTGDAATSVVTITQAAGPPTLTLSGKDVALSMGEDSDTAKVDATAQTLTVSVNIGGSADGWKVVTSNGSFVTPNPATGGADDDVELMIKENLTTASREATLTFTTTGAAPQTLVITQAGGVPTLSITGGDSRDLVSEGGSENIEVISNTDWRVTTMAPFVDSLIFTPTGGSAGTPVIPSGDSITLDGTGSGTLRIVYAANTETARRAMITLTRTGGTDIDITLMQAAGLPTIMLTSGNTVDVLNTETTSLDSIAIMFVVGGGATGWTAAVDADFVTLDATMGSSGTDTLTLKAAVKANTGVERTAIITLTATTDEGIEKAETTIMIKQGGAPPTLQVAIPTPKSGSDTTIAYDATTLNVIFTVGGGATGWEATVIDGDDKSNDFLTLVPASGTASTNTIRVTVDENTGGKRMDTVVITTVGGTGDAADTVIVTQEAVPTIEITDPIDKMITIDYNAVTDTTITFNVGGSATGWTASSDQDFVKLDTMGSSGEGIEVTATFKENKDVERSAKITLMTTGQLGASVIAEVTITQTGAPGAPKLDVTTPSGLTDTVANTATSDSIEIMFTVEKAMGWESMISYGAGVEKFVTLSDTLNDTTQTGTVTIKAAVTKNEGVERSATITLSTTGQSGFSAATREITIVQRGAPPMITESGDTTIAYDVATDTLDVITFEVGGGATGWEAKVIDGDKFLTLVDSKGGADTGTIRVTADENTGEAPRMDTIVITTEGGTGEAATDTVIVTQEEIPTIEVTDPSGGMITIDYNAVTDTTIMFNVGGSATGWTASSDQDFVKLDTMGSSGKGIEVTATPMANAETTARTAKVTITTTGQLGASITEEVTITQSAAPIISVDPHTLMLTSGNTVDVANTATVSTDSIEIMFVVGGEATGWKATVNQTFVTLDTTMGSSGTDTLTLKAAVTANTGAARTATVTITTTGQSGDSVTADVTITQATGIVPPVSNPPTLMLTSGNKVDVANTATVPADSIEIMFTVGGGATGWKATVNQTFVTLGKSTGSSGTALTLKAAVTANTVAERTATVTITTTGQSGDSVTADVTITQATGIVPPVSNPPTLMLTSGNKVDVANTATLSDSIEIMFTVGGGATGWTAAANQTFVTLGKSTGSSGTVTLKAAVTANAEVEARTATITLTTTGSTETAVDTTITITQAGSTPLSVPTQTPLAIYPNPVGNTLTIEGASTSLQISIMDFSGRQVVYSELSTGQNTLDVADLPSGLYVIIVHGEEGEVFTGQIFKK